MVILGACLLILSIKLSLFSSIFELNAAPKENSAPGNEGLFKSKNVPKTVMLTTNFPEKLGLNLSEEKSFTKHLIP